MEIKLGKSISKGRVISDLKVYNKLLSSTFLLEDLFKQDDNPMYVSIETHCFDGIKLIFSKYNGIKYKFIATKAASIYYVNLMRNYKLAAWAEYPKDAFNVEGAIVETNLNYDKKRTRCWAYDINSAYPAALMYPIPDVNVDLGAGIVEEGQIGYNIDFQEGVLKEAKEGFAQYRFELIESPFKGYVLRQYNKLQKFKKQNNLEEARKIKEGLVIAIGILRNHNPFLYTHILTRCREQINKYKDENTILINTDCIYSAVPRPEIPIGNKLGEFKELDQNGSYIYVDGADYQWDNGERCLRGIPKELQGTYDLETKTQVREPDYIMEGLKICPNTKQTNKSMMKQNN